jgi:hypothetical protein
MKKLIETIFANNFVRNYEKKNNNWNIRHLVDTSFIPANQGTSVFILQLNHSWFFSMRDEIVKFKNSDFCKF